MGSNPTPSAKFVEIIEQFALLGAYAQSNAQTNTYTTALLIFVPAVVVVIAVVAMLAAIVSISAKVNKLGSGID